MDLMALSIFFAAFLICSLLVFFLSVYGAKEVTFEENLKATGQTGKSQKKSSKGQDTKKKNAKKLALAKGPDTSEIIPNTKVSQKRFKNRKKKTDQVVVEQIQQEEIVELEEDVEIIPDITETDLARNEMVVDADFIEEIPEPEIELEEVEEKPVVQEPKRPETPIEEPEEEELEAEVEPEPEVVEPEVVEPDVVEEVKQQSSAEATPKKSKKKKNKINIEEVDAAVEEIAAPQVIEAVEVPEPVQVEVVQKKTAAQQQQQQPKKENKKKQKTKDELNLQPKTSTEDLIQLVMKTPLGDLEIQNVIDLLLTRQTGSSTSNYNDWIDASGQQNETKMLSNQLAEKDALLAEEMDKVKSITDKMAALRVELNGSRNTTVQSQRYVNDLEAQRKQLEARLHAEAENHKHYINTLQGQIQYHATRAQGLQVSLDSVQQQQATIDPAILSELEGLRNLQMSLESEKMGLESECGSLHGRLNSKTEECQQIQQTLGQKSIDLEEALANLGKASETFASLEQKNSSDSGHFEELKRVNHDLEAKVNELSSTCMQQKEELLRLATQDSGSEEIKRVNQDLEAKVNDLSSTCMQQKEELSLLTSAPPPTSEDSGSEELKKANQDLEAKVNELTSTCTQQKEQLSKLATDDSGSEELKKVNQDLEAKVNELSSTCTQQKEELLKLASEESGSEDLVAKVNELTSMCNNQKSELSRLSEQESGSEELKKVNQDLEAKVNELSSNCLKQKEELARLADENERISDQLASMAERPAAEGQEANGNESFNGNGDHHAPSDDIKKAAVAEQENLLQQKYLAIGQEHEQILKEKDVILQKMHTVESDYKSQVSKLESDLEDQRAKNNELRSKNWKTVEALNSVEQNYQKLLKSNQKQNEKPAGSDTKVLEAALNDAEVSQKDFLQRLFPSVKATEEEKHCDWLEDFASKANKWIEEQATAAATASKAAIATSEEEDKLQKLEGQVEHYKVVLAETETILNQLQASVESEETGWKSQFSTKEAQLEKLQHQLEAVEAKNTAMEASLNSLNSVEEVATTGSSGPSSLMGVRFAYSAMEQALPHIVEEMETKLRELQEKLAVEEADKIQLQNKLHQSLDSESEVTKLQEQIDTEVRVRKDLDEKVAKMNQLLTTGQEALQQEKKTVEMLRQQIVSQTPTKGSSLGTNGQDEASVVE